MSGVTLIMSREELKELTGYQQPAAQLRELHKRGFHRARRSSLGHVILERAHYEAVCRGTAGAADVPVPRLHVPHVAQLRSKL
jgi:hypothetical protein